MRWTIFLLFEIGRDLGAFTHLTVSWKKQTKSYSDAKLANNSKWEENQLIIDATTFSSWFDFLIDNTFIQFDSLIFRPVIGMPMGTNCTVFAANSSLSTASSDTANTTLSRNSDSSDTSTTSSPSTTKTSSTSALSLLTIDLSFLSSQSRLLDLSDFLSSSSFSCKFFDSH
eukprot:g76210.t1